MREWPPKPPPSLVSELLASKTPAELFDETLTELESRTDLTPARRAGLLRLGSLLFHIEAQRVRALEAGTRVRKAPEAAEGAFDLMRSRALARILKERHEIFRLVFRAAPHRLDKFPGVSGPQLPTELGKEPVIFIDLVDMFRRVLEKARARSRPPGTPPGTASPNSSANG